jgi:hypothetical protein
VCTHGKGVQLLQLPMLKDVSIRTFVAVKQVKLSSCACARPPARVCTHGKGVQLLQRPMLKDVQLLQLLVRPMLKDA